MKKAAYWTIATLIVLAAATLVTIGADRWRANYVDANETEIARRLRQDAVEKLLERRGDSAWDVLDTVEFNQWYPEPEPFTLKDVCATPHSGQTDFAWLVDCGDVVNAWALGELLMRFSIFCGILAVGFWGARRLDRRLYPRTYETQRFRGTVVVRSRPRSDTWDGDL